MSVGETGDELRERAVIEVNLGNLDEAFRLLDQARDAAIAAGDIALTARVEATHAYVVADRSDLGDAIELVDRALRFEGLDGATRGAMLQQRATLLRRAGRAAEALTAFGDAIDALQGRPRDLADVFINRGTVYLDRYDLAAAVSDFAASADNYREIGDAVAAAQADHNRGYALFLGGDLVGALEVMEACYDVQAQAGPLMKAVCDADRAEVLMAAGLVRQGGEMLRQAAAAYASKGQRQRQGEVELTLASHLAATDPGEAATMAAAAVASFREAKAPGLELRARAVEFEAGAMRPDEGLELAERLDEHGHSSTADAVRWQAVARLAADGHVEAAAELVRKLGTVAEAPLDVRLKAARAHAEIAYASGRPGAAMHMLRAGIGQFHEWQSSFGSLDLQTNVVGYGRSLTQRGLALAVESPSDTVLFEWSERARMLASRVQPVRPPADPKLAADLAELRGGADAEREIELQQQIRERAWKVRGSGQVTDPVTLAALQKGLGEQALVAYVVAPARVVALVVTATSVARVDLGERSALDALIGGLLPDLDVAASDLPGAMGAAVRSDLVARLRRLSDLLVKPLRAHVGDRPVVLTPSAVLAAVPWTLLDGFWGRPITVAQSATAWLARSRQPLQTETAGFVAGPRVVRATDEATISARAWPKAEVLTGAAATADAVSRLASSVDVLHLAAHGHHSADNPLFSGLELADGTWYGYDIDTLGSVPDVVLLSACEVGRSSVRWGEELIGLVGAWLHAGARAVIASPAVVADEAAYDVFSRLHAVLAKGVSPAEALARAVPAAGPQLPPAPFVCFS